MKISYRNHIWIVTDIFEEVADETRVELSSPTRERITTWLNTRTMMNARVR